MVNEKLRKQFLWAAGIIILFVFAAYFFNKVNNGKTNSIARESLDTAFVLPIYPTSFPALMVKQSDKDTISVPMKLNTLKMDVNVIGNMVFTTMDMVFYNDLDRNLEGQFYFPLAEGQSVTRFAVEVNDELREGVVVEKAKGRATFESVVRKGIDPGLLEWTKGNNFKARIFPIPAKGYKRLVIGYSHELLATPNSYMYYQPMAFKEPIKNFGIKVTVEQVEEQPVEKDQNGVILDFKKKKDAWITEKKISDYEADKPIAFEIPATELVNKVFVEEIPNTDSVYFYTCLKPQKFEKDKKLPGRVGIIWDVSASGNDRNIKKETKIIADYFKVLKDVEVVLIPFANDCFKPETFKIKNGNSLGLTKRIENLVYDGGTQMGCLNLKKYNVDEFLMFSDGISNFGKSEPVFSKVPFNTFVSSSVADYSFLKYMAQKTNGQFINCVGEEVGSIVDKLKFQSYRFINSTIENGNICEIYPSMAKDFNRNFSLSGKMKGKASEIEINFGFGAEIFKNYSIKIDKKNKVKLGTISRAWAQKKLDELDLFPENNLDEITAIGLKFGMITRNTSLLVLDRLEDYLEHHVVPPPGAMRNEYLAKVTKEEKEAEKQKKEHIEEVVTMFNNRKDWWNKKFEWPKKKVKKPITKNDTSLSNIPRVLVTQVVDSNDPSSEDSTSFTGTYSLSYRANGAAASPSEGADGRWNFSDRTVVTDNYTSAGTYNLAIRESGNTIRFVPPEIGASEENDEINADIELKKWESDAVYIKSLKNSSKNNVYQTYLKLKPENKTTPAYYFDASDILISKGLPEEALRVLSNIAELELENHELLRTLAHRLQQLKKYDLAIEEFKEVLKIREEEPQSYRDLGLAYSDNKQYQLAADMLCMVINKKWDSRFPEIELIAVGEVNAIIAKSTAKLDLKDFDIRFQKNLKTDIRVVIDWDSDNCDMDLWVTDPNGERTFYSHNLSTIGGKISRDFTGGYGPEEFLIKKAMPGKYLVQVDYFGSHRQTISGPTTVQAQLISGYGTKNEKRKEITIRLKTEKEVIDIGELVF